MRLTTTVLLLTLAYAATAFSSPADEEPYNKRLACFYEGENYQGKKTCFDSSSRAIRPPLGSTFSSLKLGDDLEYVTLWSQVGHSGFFANVDQDTPELKTLTTHKADGSANARFEFFRNGSIEFSNDGRACFYTHENYAGRETCYDSDTAATPVRGWYRSLKLKDGLREVKLWSREGYTGYSSRLIKDTPRLSTVKAFNSDGTYGRSIENQVWSIQIPTDDRVCFYEHQGFAGRETCYAANTAYAHASSIGAANDTWSSVRVFGRAYAVVYTNTGWWGDHTLISQNVYRLSSRNDAISSVSVFQRQSDTHACFYENYDFHGTPRCIVAHPDPLNIGARNDWVDFNSGMVDRDRVSSIKLAGNAMVEIFESVNFGGTSATLTHSQSNLGHAGVNDWIDSARVTVIDDADIDPTKKALDIQESVYSALPFNQAHIMASHNSFNSAAYLDAANFNQRDTVYEQLEQGARMLDFDTDSDLGSGLVVFCHGHECASSSSWVDITRIAGEIEDFVRQMDDNDFLVIHLENNDRKNTTASGHLENRFLPHLKPYIYEPESAGCSPTYDENASELLEVPTIRDMREQGKRILVLAEKDCYKYSAGLGRFIYDGNYVAHRTGLGRNAGGTYGTYRPYDNFHHINRIYEDRGVATSEKKWVEENSLLSLHRSGIQIHMRDHLSWANDSVGGIAPVFEAKLWTAIDPSMQDPNNTVATIVKKNLAVQSKDTTVWFEGAPDTTFTHTLCRNDEGDWFILEYPTSINVSETLCFLANPQGNWTPGGSGYRFDLPLSADEFQSLIEDADYQNLPDGTRILVNMGRHSVTHRWSGWRDADFSALNPWWPGIAFAMPSTPSVYPRRLSSRQP